MINVYLFSNCEFTRRGLEYSINDLDISKKVNIINSGLPILTIHHRSYIRIDFVIVAFTGGIKEFKNALLDLKRISIVNDKVYIKEKDSHVNYISKFNGNTFFSVDLGAFKKIKSLQDELKSFFYNYRFKKDYILKNITARELQALNYYCKGYSTKQISKLLSISTKTVSTHKKKAISKLMMS